METPTSGNEAGSFVGWIPTWIVDLRRTMVSLRSGDAVYCRLAQDEYDESDLVEVVDECGRPVGQLPDYDAEPLAPLMRHGGVTARGVVLEKGGGSEGGRAGLRLELSATAVGHEAIFGEDASDNPEAIIHNWLVQLWAKRTAYSNKTISDIRSELRKRAHEDKLTHRSSLIYRMLKGEENGKAHERGRRHGGVLAEFLKSVSVGSPAGDGAFAVFPLFPAGATPSPWPAAPEAVPSSETWEPKAIVAAFRYPPGACGGLICLDGRPFELDWHDAPEPAEMSWLSGIGVRAEFRRRVAAPPPIWGAQLSHMLRSVDASDFGFMEPSGREAWCVDASGAFHGKFSHFEFARVGRITAGWSDVGGEGGYRIVD